jgi:hypothetical protein
MKHVLGFLIAASLATLGQTTGAKAQARLGSVGGPEVFTAENAIVDTAIPFAIGAREAQQSLRGAFGWPTFQEGLVEGVYFRFDPDGYARFSPNPRLDIDVFEVICRTRTILCRARKDPMSMYLTNEGMLQLEFESITQDATFFVSEGLSEIQVPARILHPLDTQMENLLATGGNLIIRRGDKEVAKISLKGFVAAAAYLRWVAARQDYSVLPRGWPVPNSVPATATPPTTTWPGQQPKVNNVLPVAVVSTDGLTGQADQRTEQIASELRELRRMISELPTGQEARDTQFEAMPRPQTDPGTANVEALKAVADQLQAELDLLRQQPQAAPLPAPANPAPVGAAAAMATEGTEDQRLRKLEYLVTQMGFDMKTAMAVLEMSQTPTQASAPVSGSPAAPTGAIRTPTHSPLQPVQSTNLVDQILKELEDEIELPAPAEPAPAAQPQVTVEEYQLLSRYFKSVALPELKRLAGTN